MAFDKNFQALDNKIPTPITAFFAKVILGLNDVPEKINRDFQSICITTYRKAQAKLEKKRSPFHPGHSTHIMGNMPNPPGKD